MNKTRKFFATPIYPFLIALAPVITLYVQNYLGLNPADTLRPGIAYLIVATFALMISRFASGTFRGAALLGGVLILCLNAYGFAWFVAYSKFDVQISSSLFLPIWIGLTAVLYTLLTILLRRMRGSLVDITIVLNVFSLVIIAAAFAPLLFSGSIRTEVQEPIAPQGTPDHEWLRSTSTNLDTTKLPDVYFIVLDAYARGDVLQSRFAFENAEFLDWLDSEGFFIGHQSHSNYPWTHLSLASTFNGEYLDTLVPRDIDNIAPTEGAIRFLFYKAILANNFVKTSRVIQFFSALGYRIISNETGYSVNTPAPRTMFSILTAPITPFEEALITQSLVSPFLPVMRKMAAVREMEISDYDRVTGTLADLVSAAKEEGPKFVFYHIVSPHEPLCFDENGESVVSHPLYDSSPLISDKIAMKGYRDWLREHYPKNVAGLNLHLKETIQSIMKITRGRAAIVIQSDHGPSAGFDPESPSNSDIVERFGILNAIYLPIDVSRSELDSTMSSVNTFRILLNSLYGLGLPLLENRAYFSDGDLDFEEVTGALGQLAPGFE